MGKDDAGADARARGARRRDGVRERSPETDLARQALELDLPPELPRRTAVRKERADRPRLRDPERPGLRRSERPLAPHHARAAFKGRTRL